MRSRYCHFITTKGGYYDLLIKSIHHTYLGKEIVTQHFNYFLDRA